ncbi:MAG TPA: hypothetical protein VIV27_03005, partial [Halioglobus sp.]
MLCLLCATPPSLASSPSTDAQALIDELGLTPSSVTISRHPGWKPARVVVMLMPAMGAASPDFEQQLKKVAGDVELVFDRSGNVAPPANLLAGADAVVGICTPPLLQQAGAGLVWIHNYSVGMDHCKGLSETQLQHIVFTNNKRLS